MDCARLGERLKRDPERQRQAHEVLFDVHARVEALRQQFQPEFNGIVTNMQGQILATLTPAQPKLFDHYRAGHREIFQPR
jgi:hypothetical protein